MGYEYELLKKFARDHDLELAVTVIRDRSDLWTKLNTGEGDVAAARLLRRVADEKDVAFTKPLYKTPPALIQRDAPPSDMDLPEQVADKLDIPKADEVAVDAKLIKRPSELGGTTVHVVDESPQIDRILELENQITGDIEVVEVEDIASVEPLIRRVAKGEIRLTVSPQNVAQLKDEYYTNIEVVPTIGPPQAVVWAVRQNAPVLLEKLNQWISDPENGPVLDELYNKYFKERESYRERVADEYLTSETGRLSEYDELFKKNAASLGWDWRLIASQAFQESRFDPNAKSWAGAVGILQLMPGTAREVGVRNSRDPEDNVAGGVRYLAKLEKMWSDEIPDEEERRKFILASYNAGRGHVLDAQRMAEKNGDDPGSWEDVAYWLLQLSKREYYTDPVVKYGFVRGLEPVTYVELILNRYEHYKEFVVDESEAAETGS
ncbi:MAG: transglycosylase SLT domain-containing protein, partial [Acidobacteria bacterium]|nr:transglycosylase SLT domain-containing protein [Acidobacteriota bacterium]